jgi:hypothetical protein
MELKAGSRYASTVSDVNVVIVKAPAGDVELTCGGAPMVPLGEETISGAPAAGADMDIPVGKRFCDEAGEIEVLISKGGQGTLTCNGAELGLKDAKPLPSSD